MTKINWEAIGSVGQWAGAILSGFALYFALRRDRPKLVLAVIVIPTQNLGIKYSISAINNSYNAMCISRLTINHPQYPKTVLRSYDLSFLLNPAEKQLIQEIYKEPFNKYNINNNKDILKHIYLTDQYGKKHYVYNDYKEKFRRLITYVFGKKSKFHENFRKRKSVEGLIDKCQRCNSVEELEYSTKTREYLCEVCFNKN